MLADGPNIWASLPVNMKTRQTFHELRTMLINALKTGYGVQSIIPSGTSYFVIKFHPDNSTKPSSARTVLSSMRLRALDPQTQLEVKIFGQAPHDTDWITDALLDPNELRETIISFAHEKGLVNVPDMEIRVTEVAAGVRTDRWVVKFSRRMP